MWKRTRQALTKPRVLILLAALILAAAVAVALMLIAPGRDDEIARQMADGAARQLPDDALRRADRPPTAEALRAVRRFKAQDPEASFSFFNGYVDSFATTAKATIPDYALPILRELTLSTTPRQPTKLPAPRHSGVEPKPASDLDRDHKVALPILPEAEGPTPPGGKVASDPPDKLIGQPPPVEIRSRPPVNPQQQIPWQRPDDALIRTERQAVEPILLGFLSRHRAVFAVDPTEFAVTMKLIDYQVGAYFRKAVYEQHYSHDEKLLYGRTLVHFDVNWNVIGISRMITTPAKLRVPALGARAIEKEQAVAIAARAFECNAQEREVLRAERAVDPVRRLRVWDVELYTRVEDCHWRTIIDAATGTVLNVSDLIDRAYTDASVNRWYFPGGNLMDPRQIVSTGIYTRDDRRLEHDFFYVMNDHRCEGNPEQPCSETTHRSRWCRDAHGTYDGESYVRATRREERDFAGYYPFGDSEAFGETNAYYWARLYSQWLKPSLDALGVLPGSASNYPRVLIVTNTCRSGSIHSRTRRVTTEGNRGEGTNVILLAHRDPGGSSNHNAACESGGCFDNPSNLHHELNHFYLNRYYDVSSDLDCGASVQLKFTHEGILGTAVPQAFWHYYYGVGYAPPSTDNLYFSHSDVGRVHTSDDNRMTVGDNLCVDLTGDPYRAGRVVGQALWEFYHGAMVQGAQIMSTWYPSTDTDFNILVHWAADLQASSTYKDRYEFANRVMEILDKHSNWSSQGKQQYCVIFRHHELHPFINSEYCS